MAERAVSEKLSRAQVIEARRQIEEKTSKGRGAKKGKTRPSKVTSRTLKAPDGYKVTI